MNEDSSKSTVTISDNTITGKGTYVINKPNIEDTDSDDEILKEDKELANHCFNTIEIDNVEHMEAFQKEVKIDIDIENSAYKVKNELNDKNSQSGLRKVAERIISLDRRVLMTVWLVFPAFFSRKNLRNQANENTEQPDSITKQEAPPVEDRTRPQQNQGYGPPQGGGYNNGGYGGGYGGGGGGFGGGGGGFGGGGGGFGFQGMPRNVGPEYDPYERNHFIAAVFGIVLVMLVVTAICLAVIFLIPPLKLHFRHMHLFYLIGSLILYIVLTYCFICGPCSRDPCCGTVLLILTTLCMSCLAGAICVRYRAEIILYGVVATAVVCGVCLLLAMSSFDFTGCIIYVIVIGTVLMFMSIALVIATLVFHIYIKPLWLALLIASAILQSVTMIIQLQMILGHRTLEYDEGEYFLASFQLYTSVIQMFLTLVQILGLIDSM